MSNITMETFSRNLRYVLEEKGITQSDLAKKIDTTEATVSRYINGKRSPEALNVVADMARVLGVSLDYLLGLSPTKTAGKYEISTNEKILINCTRRASDDDMDVVWASMRKYLSPQEKTLIEQIEQSESNVG